MRLSLAAAFVLYFLAVTARARSFWEENDTREVVGGADSRIHQEEEVQEPVRMMSKRSRIRLCGQQLVETLKLVCRQVEASRGKREARPQFYMQRPLFTDVYKPSLDEDPAASELGWKQGAPAQQGSSGAGVRLEQEEEGEEEAALAGGFLGGRGLPDRFRTVRAVQSVQKRGLADECCARSCTLRHLMTYC